MSFASFTRPLARTAFRSSQSSRARFASSSSSTAGAGSRSAGANVALRVAIAAAALAGAVAFTPTRASAEYIAFRESSPSLDKTRIVSLAELKQHADKSDIWLSVDGNVYDVTEFLALHPGGTKFLLDAAGKDVSKLFHSIHPAQTIERFLDEGHVQFVGKLDPEALALFENTTAEEEKRLSEARSKLFGVDSIVSILDFEKHVKDILPWYAWAYYSTGADTEEALAENMNVFSRVFFRPRVMRDVTNADPSTTLLGVQSSIPVYVSPTARNALGNPEGECAVARGAGEAGILQVLSHYASRSLEDVKAAAKEGQPIGWQLYLNPDRNESARAVKRAVAAGAHSIWVTVDTTALGKREEERRITANVNPAPNGKPLNRAPVEYGRHEGNMSWNDVAWIKKLAPGLPVVVKGVGAWEDVVLAQKAGADAIVLSNHGGRQLNYAQPALKTLYDVNKHAPQTLHRKDFSIFLDGGVRHGTDVLKALCLGARGVGLGRPFIFAANGWGADGVEKLVMILQEEMTIGMKLLGVTSVDQLGPEYLDLSKI